MHRQFVLATLLLALALLPPAAALAQDASPVASPAAGPCETPELPPGTPTPMEAAPGVEEGEVLPVAPFRTPATGDGADAAGSTQATPVNCVNAGEFLAVAALVTDEFSRGFLEVPTPCDVPATFEEAPPVAVRSLGNAQAYADGTLNVNIAYDGVFNGPGQARQVPPVPADRMMGSAAGPRRPSLPAPCGRATSEGGRHLD